MRFYNLETALQHADQATELLLHGRSFSTILPSILNLQKLKKLELSNCQITNIPDELIQLSDLVELSLPDNQLESIPKVIFRLERLKRLNLSKNEIDELPTEINNLKQLEHLTLSSNLLQSLPNSLIELKNLRRLDLSYNQILKLPSNFGAFPKLRRLNLVSNKLRRLPKSFFKATQLDLLNLSHNQLQQIPAEIGQLQQLNHLFLNKNRLKYLPEKIRHCTFLRQIAVNQNRLLGLPKSVGQLKWLSNLSCTQNQLTDLPEEINACVQLQILNCSENQIIHIPKGIEQLRRLFRLDLSKNQIQQIKALPIKLEDLDLSRNHLKTFPLSLCTLNRLEKLNISYNQIQKFPAQIKKLQQLSHFYFSHNPIHQVPEILIHLDQLKSIKGFSFYPPVQLLQFIRACKKKQVPGQLRQSFYQIFQGKYDLIPQLSLSKLFQGLQLGVDKIEHPIRSHLLGLRTKSINHGDAICILGRINWNRKQLEEELKMAGLKLQKKPSNKDCKLLLGKAPNYSPNLERNSNYINEQALNQFLDQQNNRYLAIETNPEKLNHLEQLLLHEQEVNVWMALQLMKGGGVPKALLTILFFLSRTHQSTKVKADCKALLSINLSEESRQQVQIIGNLSKRLSKKVWQEKLNRLAEVAEFDEQELKKLFDRLKN